jgi:DNA-binding NarL/FixJ family response regulator
MTDIRVLIADDQKVVRDGLALLLGLLDGIEVVGTAIDGADALRQVAVSAPDIVLMDLNMPQVDGVTATRELLDAYPRVRVVVLTTYADDASVFAALQAGARGFLTKDAGADEIRQAITTVAGGEAQLDPSVQRRLLEALAAGAPAAVAAEPTPPHQLTARETEVLVEIAAGLSNGQIADRLYVSEATVKTHVNHLLAKTGLRDRAQLVAYAYQHRIAVP